MGCTGIMAQHFDDLKSLADDDHGIVRRAPQPRTFTRKILPMCLPPVIKRSVAFTFNCGEIRTNLIERLFINLRDACDQHRFVLVIKDDFNIADARQRLMRRLITPSQTCATAFLAGKNECQQLARKFSGIAKCTHPQISARE